MIRATTPTHALIFEPGVLDEVEQLMVSYKQDRITRDVIWAYSDSDVIQVNGDRIIVAWDQEQTARFRPDRDLAVQVRLYTEDGWVGATGVMESRVLQTLNDSILGGAVTPTEGWKWEYEMTAEELTDMYNRLGIPPDEDEYLDVTSEELETLADKLGIAYEPGLDVILTSVEAGKIAKAIGLKGGK